MRQRRQRRKEGLMLTFLGIQGEETISHSVKCQDEIFTKKKLYYIFIKFQMNTPNYSGQLPLHVYLM